MRPCVFVPPESGCTSGALVGFSNLAPEYDANPRLAYVTGISGNRSLRGRGLLVRSRLPTTVVVRYIQACVQGWVLNIINIINVITVGKLFYALVATG